MANKQWPQGADPAGALTGSEKIGMYQSTAPSTSKNVEASLDEIAEYARGTTKVIWTGPLSVVDVETSLDSGEKFSDWDLIEFDVNFYSDTQVTDTHPITIKYTIQTKILAYSDSGAFGIEKLTDTTFQIHLKGIALGNIQRIIGIKL